MLDNYDFSNAVKNPYAKRLKQTVTIRLSTEVIEYFKQIAQEVQLPYQTLINSYLTECVREKRRPLTTWQSPAKR